MWRMLKHIGRTYRRKLIITFSLVSLGNPFLPIYPVSGGWAINTAMKGNVWQAMLYDVVVLLIWIIDAARKIVDTRAFTQIYTEIVVPVVLEQCKREVPHSTITACVALSRELVNFFEEHLPVTATSSVPTFGVCVMLLILEFWVGVLAVVILALFLWLLPRLAIISENLYFHLSNRLEYGNHLIHDDNGHQFYRHCGWVVKLRVLTFNREALGYLSIDMAMSILFGFTFIHMTLKDYGNAGHTYSVSTCLWMSAVSLDDVPHLVEQHSNLKDIGQRVELLGESNLSKAVRNLNTPSGYIMGWLYLILAGILEIGWPLGLKLVQQGGHRWQGIAAVLARTVGSGFFLFLVQRNIPIGTVYAVRTGIGAAGAFLVSVTSFSNTINSGRRFGVLLVISGVIVTKLPSR